MRDLLLSTYVVCGCLVNVLVVSFILDFRLALVLVCHFWFVLHLVLFLMVFSRTRLNMG
jgi:hypothetical protein